MGLDRHGTERIKSESMAYLPAIFNIADWHDREMVKYVRFGLPFSQRGLFIDAYGEENRCDFDGVTSL